MLIDKYKVRKNTLEEKYYIYKWYVVDTGFVFYIGKGIKNRFKVIKKRSQCFKNYINKYECKSEIIEYCDSEDAAFEKEKQYISYYKSIGMATANFHEGGLGGNIWKYSDEEKFKEFRERMTKINQERCSSEKFKENARKNMIKRYENPEERQKQAEKQKAVWTPEKRKQQSELLKNIPNIQEMYKQRNAKFKRKCRLEYNSECIDFDSRAALLAYLKNTYGFQTSRKTEQDMLHNKTAYVAFQQRYKKFDGLKMYYL